MNPEQFLTQLANRLDREVRARHFKRTAFAHGKVSPNTVRSILQGKDHRLSTLILLADALECDLVIDIQPRIGSQEPNAQSTAHES